ncbi:hypothetical protein EDD16DRAFT_1517899 [Pisolithus croceorrhizus]|nr:hypothetical protein EDD16DRAFT_1517899 [Pisolithus croceorrhizus]
MIFEQALVFNLPRRVVPLKKSPGDQHLISRQGWWSSRGQRIWSGMGGKGVKNDWKYHMTREHKGLELSSGEAWLVLHEDQTFGARGVLVQNVRPRGLAFPTGQAKNGTTQFPTNQWIAIGKLMDDLDTCCARESNKVWRKVAEDRLQKVQSWAVMLGLCEPGLGGTCPMGVKGSGLEGSTTQSASAHALCPWTSPGVAGLTEGAGYKLWDQGLDLDLSLGLPET